LGRDLAVEALEVANVDRVDAGTERADGQCVPRVLAALLAEAHVDRHLAALEPGPHLVRPRAGLLTLDPAARVATLARAQAAADALPVLARGGRLERVQAELLVGHGLVLDHLDEVTHLPELTGELRALRVLDRAADLAQPERPQRAAVPLALADRATNLL